MEYNFIEIGNRIVIMRKKHHWSQERFIEELNNKGLRISRNTISAIENGTKQQFSLDFLLTCCELFECDMGYLLGEYSECKTLNHQFIHNGLGLSEKSIQSLHLHKQLDDTHISNIIDDLLLDLRYHNIDENNNRHYRPILNLMNYFFRYTNSGSRKQVYSNGTITDCRNDGFISENAIELNDTVIENAVLAEIQLALINLKRQREEMEAK